MSRESFRCLILFPPLSIAILLIVQVASCAGGDDPDSGFPRVNGAAGYANLKPTAYHIATTVLLEHNNDTIILSANASALSSG